MTGYSMDSIEPLGGHGKADPRLSPRAQALLDRVQNAADFKPKLDSAYVVKGWLTSASMSVVYGDSNVGKSFFAVDLARHIAAGRSWNGCRVRGGPVLLIACEGGHGIGDRVSAIEGREGLALWVLPIGLDLHKGGDAPALVAMIKYLTETHGPYALIVVDTLARSMGAGDENSSADMGSLVRNLDLIRAATGAHVMVIHHTGKDSTKGARGHSSLRAAVDSEIELTKDGSVIIAETKKQRDMAAGRTFAFRLVEVELGRDQDGDRVSTCRVQACDVPDRRPKLTGASLIALEALDDAVEQYGAVRKQEGVPSCRVVSISKWREMADRHGLSDADDPDNRDRAFRRAVKTLRDRHFIRQFNGLAWRCSK